MRNKRLTHFGTLFSPQWSSSASRPYSWQRSLSPLCWHSLTTSLRYVWMPLRWSPWRGDWFPKKLMILVRVIGEPQLHNFNNQSVLPILYTPDLNVAFPQVCGSTCWRLSVSSPSSPMGWSSAYPRTSSLDWSTVTTTAHVPMAQWQILSELNLNILFCHSRALEVQHSFTLTLNFLFPAAWSATSKTPYPSHECLTRASSTSFHPSRWWLTVGWTSPLAGLFPFRSNLWN